MPNRPPQRPSRDFLQEIALDSVVISTKWYCRYRNTEDHVVGRDVGTCTPSTCYNHIPQLGNCRSAEHTPTIDERTIMQPYPTSPLSNSSAQEGNVPAAQSALPSGTEPEASLCEANSGRLSAVRKSRVALACKRCKRRKQRVSCIDPIRKQQGF
jgi:hypothetical protein